MSIPTTKHDSAQQAGSAVNPPADTKSNGTSVSVEDVERAASQFKPAWEADSFDAFDEAALAGSAPAQDLPAQPARQAPSATTTHSQPEPPALAHAAPAPVAQDVPPSSQSRTLELVDAAADLGNDQGPVDIVADIPKRADVQLKDEPSVVVADDQERKRPTVPPPARARASKPAPAVALPDDDELPVGRQSRNRKIVIGVVAVAGLLVLAAGVRLAFQSDDTPKPPDAPPAVVTPVATQATATPTMEPTPTPTPEPQAPTPPETAAATIKRPPAATAPEPEPTKPPSVAAAEEPLPQNTAHTKPSTHSTTTTAAESPPPAPTKPPAPPTKAEPPPKPPAGGIVRETPF